MMVATRRRRPSVRSIVEGSIRVTLCATMPSIVVRGLQVARGEGRGEERRGRRLRKVGGAGRGLRRVGLGCLVRCGSRWLAGGR